MTRKRRKKSEHISVHQNGAAPDGDEEMPRFRPKAGPGQVFKRELVGMQSGHAKRYRNLGCSPLMLAFHRGQLECAEDRAVPAHQQITAEDRFSAGERFEKYWYVLHRSGSKDSLDDSPGGLNGLFFTEAKETASRAVHALQQRMQVTNYRIITAFCGDGHAMATALRIAGVVAHPVGTAYRIREALDDLVLAMTGRGGEIVRHAGALATAEKNLQRTA